MYIQYHTVAGLAPTSARTHNTLSLALRYNLPHCLVSEYLGGVVHTVGILYISTMVPTHSFPYIYIHLFCIDRTLSMIPLRCQIWTGIVHAQKNVLRYVTVICVILIAIFVYHHTIVSWYRDVAVLYHQRDRHL